MKFRVKINWIMYLAAALLTVVMTVFFVRSKGGDSLLDKALTKVLLPPEKTAVKRPPVKLERYSSYLESTSDFSGNSGTGELAAALNDCAVKIFKAVLPENSALQMPLDIELSDENSARVSGKAIIFGDSRNKEQILQCQVKIHFLANGSCQAEYPVFVESK